MSVKTATNAATNANANAATNAATAKAGATANANAATDAAKSDEIHIDFTRYESDREACAGLRKVAEAMNTVDTFLANAGAPLSDEQLWALRSLNRLLSTTRINDMRAYGRNGARYIK